MTAEAALEGPGDNALATGFAGDIAPETAGDDAGDGAMDEVVLTRGTWMSTLCPAWQ